MKKQTLEKAIDLLAQSCLFKGTYWERYKQASQEITPDIVYGWRNKDLINKAEWLASNTNRYSGIFVERRDAALLELCKDPFLYERLREE